METSFNDLPKQIDILLGEIMFIKKILLQKEEKVEIKPKAFDFKTALIYINANGIRISASKMYKMCASKSSGFPAHRAARQLVFFQAELDFWIDSLINEESKNFNLPFSNSVVATAQKLINPLKKRNNGKQ